MDIVVRGMNIGLSETDRDYAERKISKLDRYLPNIIEARIELRNEKNKQKEQPVAQLTVRNNRGVILRTEDKKQQDFHAAIDMVVDKMYRQIQRYKGKSQRNRKESEQWLEQEADWAGYETVPVDEVPDYDEVPTREVVRRKSVLLTPMSEREAIDQMDLLGHAFFLFYNGSEDTINVLYRRDDGQYGILTPSID